MMITGAQARSTAMRACSTPSPQPTIATLPPMRAFIALAAWMQQDSGSMKAPSSKLSVSGRWWISLAGALTYSAKVPSVWMPSWVKLLHSSWSPRMQ